MSERYPANFSVFCITFPVYLSCAHLCFSSNKAGFSENASRRTHKKVLKFCFSKRTRQRGHFAVRLAIIRFLSSENENQTYLTWLPLFFFLLELRLLSIFLSKEKEQLSPCQLRLVLVLEAQETDDSESYRKMTALASSFRKTNFQHFFEGSSTSILRKTWRNTGVHKRGRPEK